MTPFQPESITVTQGGVVPTTSIPTCVIVVIVLGLVAIISWIARRRCYA